ncbi:MAG: hypothetical protein A3D65_06075 [Candidatus Lloydbacteria bacterium RIFCSPHIGHO2_02_FULL_50_13]|uniref:histidine kinase n=1 Tax=Candidatus Lloydbacteria bacterium RIFCSPHIGHO2_02_FULL_50_13 TaxID=1798661 RepID=A0A1G2D1Y8_9BACT|nr:MAG: hypothetical protein A3D65_06075 [Candidatus Lloydbacteria bacterium RIFCSPHIGHO2_02_FULL_50_13]
MTTTLPDNKNLWPETRLILARWFYVPLGFFLLLIGRRDAFFVGDSLLLGVVFVVMLLGNIFLFWYIRQVVTHVTFPAKRTFFNAGQTGLDLVFFFFVMFYSGGVGGIGHALFFIPILASTLIFTLRGTMMVAVFSSVFVLLAASLEGGLAKLTASASWSAVDASELLVQFGKWGTISALYLLAGFFGGFISQSIKRRDLLLLGEIAKGQEQVKRLQKLTDEFDKSAKLLVRRDIELVSANEKLTQLDRMKSEIISVVAHQLRTPLSAIKWTLKMLLDEDTGKLTKGQQGLLAKGFESNERMVVLINDMLAVDYLESGKLKYNFIPVQFESLVQEMVSNLLPIATHKKIRVEFTPPKELLPKVKIDPDKMRDVFQNLIDNAIKYTKEGGLVTANVAMEAEGLHFWIKDNGIGIPEDAKGKIFSRFFRAKNAISTETDGSGLGLFIAQSVVKRHGGKVWFESVLNEGTTFHVLLPLTP